MPPDLHPFASTAVSLHIVRRMQGHRMCGQAECWHVQVNQFEGILQHCLATPGVHVIDLPINYAVSAQLQVSP